MKIVKKAVYVFIISVLFCGFSHIFGAMDNNSKLQLENVQESVRILQSEISNLFYWFYMKFKLLKECAYINHNQREFCLYDIMTGLELPSNRFKEEDKTMSDIKSDYIEIAKKLLLTEYKIRLMVIEKTLDNESISKEKLQEALMQFAKDAYIILDKEAMFENSESDIKEQINSITKDHSCLFGFKKDKHLAEIEKILITPEIRKEITSQIEHKIKLFSCQSRESQNKALGKKWPLYAGILGGIIIATGVSFGIYYGVKKGKSGEEEEQTVLLVDK